MINKNFTIEASDFHSTMLLRNRFSNLTAQQYHKAFMNKLFGLLDEKGIYVEYRAKKVPEGSED
jgi:hypothetical protein